MNKLGFQIEKFGPAQKMMIEATNPWTIKVLQGGKSIGDLRNWRARQPNGPLVCRFVFDPGPLEDMDRRLNESISFFSDLKEVGGPLLMEVPFNEEHQNGDALYELAERSISACDRILSAGFRPIVLITSEGNPHDLEQWRSPRLHTALRELRKRRAVWGPHEYSAPPLTPLDGWHSGRWTKVYGILPVDCQLLIYFGECGIDGGINTGVSPQRMETGWRGYMDARGYANHLNTLAVHYANNHHVYGAAVFLSGTFGRWASFDIGDEVDLRECFTRALPGPGIWEPEAIPDPPVIITPPPPVVIVPPVEKPKPVGGSMILSVPVRESPAVPANYSTAKRNRTDGVVIHSTGGQSNQVRNEYTATLNHFQNPDASVSAHDVIGPDEVAHVVQYDMTAWHAKSQNSHRIGLEFAHADTPGADAAGYSAFQYAAGGEVIGKLAKQYGFPLVHVTDETKPGLIFHRDTVDGKKDGKRDPTGNFFMSRLIAEARKWVDAPPVDVPIVTPPVKPPVTTTSGYLGQIEALRDKTWALADEWEREGFPRVGIGIKSTIALSKGEK